MKDPEGPGLPEREAASADLLEVRQAVFETLPLPATLIDARGIILDVNAAFLELARRYGYELRREDRIGRPIVGFARPVEEQDRFNALIGELLRTGQRQHLLWEYADETGRRIYWDLRAEPIQDAAGRPAGALILREDVTGAIQRERRQQALVQVQNRVWQMRDSGDIEPVLSEIREGLQAAGFRFAQCDINLVEVTPEPHVAAVYTAGEQGPWRKIPALGPGDAAILEIWQTGRPRYRRDLSREDFLGEREYIEEIYGHPVRSVLDIPFAYGTLALNSREPEAFTEEEIAFLQELSRVLDTGLTRLYEIQRLEQAEMRYRTLVEQAPVGLSIWQGGRIVFANEAMGQLTGYTCAELYALSHDELQATVHPEDWPQVLGYFEKRLNGVSLPEDYELRLLHRDGSVRWTMRSARRIAWQEQPAVQVIDRDITARKRMEEEQLHLERFRAIGGLSAGISHNLNNILTTILGPAQILRRKMADPALRREADTIIDSARRAQDLVHRLHVSVRGEEERPQRVSLTAAVEEAVRLAQPRWKAAAEARGIPLEVVTRLAAVPPVWGTPAGLRDIVTNLLFNAVEAMPEGGTLAIETRPVEGGAQLVFSDTGLGMDEETRKRVFEPFFTTKRDVGSGLGLSTVHGLLTGWGGDIEVESAPGQGTTFTLFFPTGERGEERDDGERTAAGPKEQGGRLLIVEDDPGVSQLLSRLLSPSYEVDVCANGREALNRFAANQYAAVLIDLSMPGLAGDEVARRMARIDPGPTRVLITGWELAPDDPRLQGFDFQLQKPFGDLDEVEAVVARAMELHDEHV